MSSYLFNDFSMEFNPPIYNKKENDRIFSIQIDHLLISDSGIFILETKNWSKQSIKNLDLRSPVKQILRTSYALFVLLNSESEYNKIKLNRHHWGSKVTLFVNIDVAFTHEASLSSPGSFSGFNQTDSGRSQFRISPDHRFGFALLAAA